MIKFIKCVREDILNKDIYIWNVNRNSADILMYLGLMGINIKGFVIPSYIKDYRNKNIMNRSLINVDEFCTNKNAVLIIADDCVTIKDVQFPEFVKIYKYSDCLAMDYNLYRKNVYIYGAGIGAKRLTDIFKAMGIKIKGYVTTNSPKKGQFDAPSAKYDLKNFTENDIIVISTLEKNYILQILQTLSDCPADVYCNLEDIVDNELYVIQYLNNAISENKQVFILGENLAFNETVKNFISIYNINIANKIGFSMDDLYDLTLQSHDNMVVMINEFDVIKRMKILDELKLSGYSIKNRNIVSFQNIIHHKKNLLGENTYITDALVLHSQKYGSADSCGWKVLKNSDNVPKIIILGGSTSAEELYEPETWMRKLYKKLNNLKLNCTIYIGAAAGYRVIHELLKFLRDGHIIKPDIVISMSGINDVLNANNKKNSFNVKFHYSSNKFEVSGIPSSESCYEYWLRIEKMFKVNVEALGAKFFPFFQPMNISPFNVSIDSRLMCEAEWAIKGSKDYVNFSVFNDIYVNLMSLFHNQPERFIDVCHYTDEAAEILSDKVLETILPTVKEIYMNNSVVND